MINTVIRIQFIDRRWRIFSKTQSPRPRDRDKLLGHRLRCKLVTVGTFSNDYLHRDWGWTTWISPAALKLATPFVKAHQKIFFLKSRGIFNEKFLSRTTLTDLRALFESKIFCFFSISRRWGRFYCLKITGSRSVTVSRWTGLFKRLSEMWPSSYFETRDENVWFGGGAADNSFVRPTSFILC